MTIGLAEGTSEALRLMGATARTTYITQILEEQTPDRLLVPSIIPARTQLTAPAIKGKLVQVFGDEDVAAALKVPLYYKSRGKGRGKPVFFAPERTAVGQLFGMFRRRGFSGTATDGCDATELAQQLGFPEPEFTSYSMGVW